MTKERKTTDEWELEQYAYGSWEVVHTVDTWAEAKESLAEYRANQAHIPIRATKRRVKIVPDNMTPSELKALILREGNDRHFFDRETMRYFGDTMANYGVRSACIESRYNERGEYAGKQNVRVEVWELYRKKPVKDGLRSSAYFSKVTLRRMFKE